MRGHVLSLVLAMVAVCDGEKQIVLIAYVSDQTQRGRDSDGHREYTMTGNMTVHGETTDLGCIECDSTRECYCTRQGCTKGIDVSKTESLWVADTADISIHVSFEAWEGYNGSRCTYDKSTFTNGDDGYVSQSCIFYPENYTQSSYHKVTCTGSQAALKMAFKWENISTPAPETHAPPTASSSSVKVLAAVCAVVVVGAVVAGVMYNVRSQGSGAADVPAQGAPLDEYAAHEDVSSEECVAVVQ